MTHLEDSQNLCIVEIKISAGPIGEIFMNSSEEVMWINILIDTQSTSPLILGQQLIAISVDTDRLN